MSAQVPDNMGNSPLVQRSDEFKALKERVIAGNDKLFKAWCQIKELAEDKEKWYRFQGVLAFAFNPFYAHPSLF